MKRLFNNICAIGFIIALIQALFYAVEYIVRGIRFVKRFATEYKRILSERKQELKRIENEHLYM